MTRRIKIKVPKDKLLTFFGPLKRNLELEDVRIKLEPLFSESVFGHLPGFVELSEATPKQLRALNLVKEAAVEIGFDINVREAPPKSGEISFELEPTSASFGELTGFSSGEQKALPPSTAIPFSELLFKGHESKEVYIKREKTKKD